MILNGEKFGSSLLMTVIRFVMPSQDHMVKKLLLVFWEVVPKYSPDGKMLHEMILVCDAYRKVSVKTQVKAVMPYLSGSLSRKRFWPLIDVVRPKSYLHVYAIVMSPEVQIVMKFKN